MMRIRKPAVLVLVLALVISANLAGQGSPAPEPAVLINAHLVDVRSGRVTPNTTLSLRDGKISSIGQPPPAGIKTVDIRGKYLLPGLSDAHTHLTSMRAARTALESGVTTVRSAGVSSYLDVGLRELVQKRAIPGPDVLAAGYHVRPFVAEEAFISDPAISHLMSGVHGSAQIREMVRTNLSHGVDVIKILATERAGTADTDPRKQVYSEAELRAAVEEAAGRGIPVLAHAHGDEGAMAAVKAGVRSIEHGTYLSDATLALMKDRGTFYVPTYTTVEDLVEPGGDYDNPALQIRGRHMLPRLALTVQKAHKTGVKIVAGADTGYGPNSLTRISHEVANFVKLGMTPLEAIQTATVRAAELFRLEKSIGSIEVGFEADLIAVEGNPLENIGALQDVLLVISNGSIVMNRLDFGKD